MRLLGFKVYLLSLLLSCSFACAPLGDGWIEEGSPTIAEPGTFGGIPGGSMGGSVTGEAEGEAEGEASVATPADEGFDIPVNIAKATLPSIDATRLAVVFGEETSSRSSWFVRQAYAQTGENFLTIQGYEGCVHDIPEGTAVTVVFKNSAGEITEVSPSASGSFSAIVADDDSFSIYLRDQADATNTGAPVSLMLNDGNFFDAAITTSSTDHKNLFASYSFTRLGYMTKPETFQINDISITEGTETALFNSQTQVVKPLWDPEGNFITFMNPNGAVFKHDINTQEMIQLVPEAVALPLAAEKRSYALSSNGVLAYGKQTEGGDATVIEFLNIAANEVEHTVILPVKIKLYDLEFSPDNDTLVIIGKKADPTGLKTAVYLIGPLSLGGTVTKKYEGTDLFYEWTVTRDSLGFVASVNKGGGSQQLIYYPFDASAPVKLTNAPGKRNSPTFSNDGKWLAYTKRENSAEATSIYLLDYTLDSPEEMQLTNGMDNYTEPLFAGDENILSYLTTDTNGYLQIFVKNLDLL